MTTPRNAVIAEALRGLLERHGRDLASNPGRLSALLRDVAGPNRLEIALVLAAAEEGVPSALDVPDGMISDRSPALARRLAEARGLTTENATWAVGVWQQALRPPRALSGHPVALAPSLPPTETAEGRVSRRGDTEDVDDRHVGRPMRPVTPTSKSRLLPILIGAAAATAILGVGLWFTVGPGKTPGDPLPPVWGAKTASGSLEGASVTLSWSPATDGATPTGYEILRDGRSIADTASFSYTDEDVIWGEQHRYQIVAVAGDVRSAPGETWTTSIGEPSLDDARLTGSFGGRVVQQGRKGFTGNLSHNATWHFEPTCATGPCDVRWTSEHTISSPDLTYSGTLSRDGPEYDGTAKQHDAGISCNGKPIQVRYVFFTVKVKDAAPSPDGSSWDATRLSGTMYVKIPVTPGCIPGYVYLEWAATSR